MFTKKIKNTYTAKPNIKYTCLPRKIVPAGLSSVKGSIMRMTSRESRK